MDLFITNICLSSCQKKLVCVGQKVGICKDKEKRVPLTVYFPILLLFLTTSRPFIGGGNTEPSSSPHYLLQCLKRCMKKERELSLLISCEDPDKKESLNRRHRNPGSHITKGLGERKNKNKSKNKNSKIITAG